MVDRKYHITFGSYPYAHVVPDEEWGESAQQMVEARPSYDSIVTVNAPDAATAIAKAMAERINEDGVIQDLLAAFMTAIGWQLDIPGTGLTPKKLEELDRLIALWAGGQSLLRDMTCMITADGDATWENIPSTGLTPIQSEEDGFQAYFKDRGPLPTGWRLGWEE